MIKIPSSKAGIRMCGGGGLAFFVKNAAIPPTKIPDNAMSSSITTLQILFRGGCGPFGHNPKADARGIGSIFFFGQCVNRTSA